MCQCYAGFDGSACQRTTCPNDCNGHGVCQSNQDFAEDYARAMAESINKKQRMPRCPDGATDYSTCARAIEHDDDYYKTYMVSYENAWDSGLQYGCRCDSGFSGADCSERECPTSFDPLDSSCLEDMQTSGVTWGGSTWDEGEQEFSETTLSLTKTNIENSVNVPALWENLPIPVPDSNGLDLTTIKNPVGSKVATYLDYFGQTSIFYAPKEFKSGTTHFSDMARRCTSFYISPGSLTDAQQALMTLDKVVEGGTTTLAWGIAPVSADSWMCNYMWDSTMTKTPYCAGRWTSLECSGRGICDKSTGTCACSAGYTGNDCSEVSALG